LAEAQRTSTAAAAALQRDEWGRLENFHKKFNKVLLDKLAIQQEQRRLEQENHDLRGILKQYLDGIAVSGDVVDKANPLLIVNGRVNLLPSERVRRRPGGPTTVAEGTQIVASYAMQTKAMSNTVNVNVNV
jgi:hypothetical protein